ncbi:MAG: SUMF1/EgtB/PvdO family nonheme iron enzyme [Candidatus Delongbacteria bacterium]|nr:SUMF1/EgtB/PvdO family nonheme iron enzyme [Candidatus Delongbacteria bacterium]
MTYLNDSPNSAMDIDFSKDGIITIEDLVQFADNRLGDYTKTQGLPSMNPVYQTEGGISYEPFMLFRYNAEKVVAEQKKEGAKPIFQYDSEAELAKIKKFNENKEYLKENLPVYQPKVIQDKTIKVDDTDLSSWKLAMAQEEEIKAAKEAEERKAREAKDKERVYNELKAKYNKAIDELDRTEDIFVKHEKLERLRNEVNSVKYSEVKQKLLPLLEPVYQKIKEAKTNKQAELDKLKPQFEKDIKDIEEMNASPLSEELKQKYLAGFKKKWEDYAKIQKDEKLASKYKMLFIPKVRSSVLGDLVFVEGGTESDEKPVHSVTVGDFYIGKTEVTQAQWEAVMGNNPSNFKGDNKPVEQVNWYEAVEFCNKLSEMEGLQKCYSGSGDNISCNFKANGYRLPKESEWEYAAKGGNQSRGYTYSGSDNVSDVAWYSSNSGSETHSVATKQPNELGIYDMSGNVWEWCWDWYTEGSTRVLRGGSWYSYDLYCEVSDRNYHAPDHAYDGFGFRIARTY